jgi:DNA ligase (NAD+)
MSLIYENGELQYCVTRGDGVTGEDVTAKRHDDPLDSDARAEKRPFEVRGEVYMPKKSLKN